MGQRHRSREFALSYLYQWDSAVAPLTEDPIKFAQHFEVDETARPFFLEIVEGVKKRKEEIDPLIEGAAENWRLSRMGRIDRTVMRMAAWELMECLETDLQVIIDEAVELAKAYGSSESAAFVNGILDRLAKKIRSTEPEVEEEVLGTAAIPEPTTVASSSPEEEAPLQRAHSS